MTKAKWYSTVEGATPMGGNPFVWGGRSYLGLFMVLCFLVLDLTGMWFFIYTEAGRSGLAWMDKRAEVLAGGIFAMTALTIAAWPRRVE